MSPISLYPRNGECSLGQGVKFPGRYPMRTYAKQFPSLITHYLNWEIVFHEKHFWFIFSKLSNLKEEEEKNYPVLQCDKYP